MNVVVFDLELTAWEGSAQSKWSRPGEFPEIIQIGAVKLEQGRELVEIDSLAILVRPTLNPNLSEYITDLTGITNDALAIEGVSFPEAIHCFCSFVRDARSVMSFGGDAAYLDMNCKLHGLPIVTRNYSFIDIRGLLCSLLGIASNAVTSATLPAHLGLSNSARAHDGLADSRAVTQVLRHLAARRRALKAVANWPSQLEELLFGSLKQ